MRIKGAMTILTNRAAWYGKTVEWLVDAIDNGFKENVPYSRGVIFRVSSRSVKETKEKNNSKR